MRKCAVPNCAKLVGDEYKKKTCPHCLELARARNKRYNATAKGKASGAQRLAKQTATGYEKSAARKNSKKRRYHEPKGVARRATDDFRIRKSKAGRKYSKTAHAVARSKSTMNRIATTPTVTRFAPYLRHGRHSMAGSS